MKPSDFRIGNIITDENGFEMYVVGIGEDWLTADFDGNQGDVLEFDFKNSFPKPVELTEEILLKCGFEKGLKYFSYKDFDIDLTGWFGFNNMVANANIKYLHQLQNLYSILTNEELKLK